jgi:hypothetical protein
MATQLDAICRSSGINLDHLSKRTGLKYGDVVDILDGKKTPTPHALNALMAGVSFYTKKSFTEKQAIDLLRESAGTTHEQSIMRMKSEPGLVIRDTNGTPIFESQKVARQW